VTTPTPRAPDHFSGVSSGYAEFRPRYPRALFEFIASIAPSHDRAWDCGAGSGQASVDLAESFRQVVATDLSAAQIAHAPAHPGIVRMVAAAEAAPILKKSVDAVTIAQALHWFDHARFYGEVRRVSVPGAAVVAWTYMPSKMEGEPGAIHDRLMFETLRGYWPAERWHVDSGYREIPFPFERVEAPVLRLDERWPLDRLTGYMRTWSATARYRKQHGIDPVVAVERDLRSVWGDPEEQRAISWPLVVLAGRVAE
jgi:SAM-dependent methyltransferase